MYRSHYAGGHALKAFLPECHPVLWPEHFDVAATEDEVNYGVSAGDEHHPTPYAYVGPWTVPTGPFWNAPFGALYPLEPGRRCRRAHQSASPTSSQRGRSQLQTDRSAQ